MTSVLLFGLGAAVGSFLNVISLRYDPDRWLWWRPVWSGRSHCPHCGRTLRWFELVPLVSFLALGRRCRTCRAPIAFQYFLVELVGGAVFAFLPVRLAEASFYGVGWSPEHFAWAAAFWMAVAAGLILLALIDYRLQIIPDELTVFLAVLGLAGAAILSPTFSLTHGSWLGPYGLLFGFRDGILFNRLAGAAAGALFLGGLFLLTRGRGIGLGDVKLSFALGLVFGWPDVLALQLFAFVIGSVAGIWALSRGKKSFKSFLPFGPFLALGAGLLVAGGFELAQQYFALFPV